MLGSISKIRPCGHSHVYKYAHAKKYSDMVQVAAKFKEESDGHGNWQYFLTNVQELSGIFTDPLPNLSNVDVVLPNCTTGTWGANCTTPISWRLDMPKATHTHAMMFRSKNLKDTYLILPEATNISAMNGENSLLGTYNLYAPKATSCNTIFSWGGYGASGIDKMNMYIPSATDIGGITMYDIPYLKYDIDEDGNCTTISGKPKVESVFMTFKNLEKGSMQLAQLNKEYSTAFLNDLPDWTGNTTTHSLTLGIHFDLKYDPELQTELLKVGNNYTPTINVSGGPTTNKNWDLTVNWNGTSDGGAYMIPYVPAIEFSSNDLPENYTRCNYLESNGNQYIKTDYVPTGATGMYVDAYKTGGDMICGCTEYWYYWGGGNFILLGYNTYYGDVQYNRDTKGRMKAPYHYVGRLNYKNDRTMVVETDGVNRWIKENLPELNFTPTRDIYFFRHNRATNGNPISSFQGKVYRAQITEGEDLIRDFVPCLDAEGVPCMRDLVNGVDYYNSGSGQFTYELS